MPTTTGIRLHQSAISNRERCWPSPCWISHFCSPGEGLFATAVPIAVLHFGKAEERGTVDAWFVLITGTYNLRGEPRFFYARVLPHHGLIWTQRCSLHCPATRTGPEVPTTTRRTRHWHPQPGRNQSGVEPVRATTATHQNSTLCWADHRRIHSQQSFVLSESLRRCEGWLTDKGMIRMNVISGHRLMGGSSGGSDTAHQLSLSRGS